MTYSLNKWQGITESEWVTYHAHNNQERLRYLMGHISTKSRILEVGCGCGFQAGCIMKYKRPSRYFGFDPDSKKILSCTNMYLENKEDIKHSMSFFFDGDLFDINRILLDVDKLFPGIILFTEVLEHIPQYKKAFRGLYILMPAGSILLMTVPAKGMLRDVPGHINDFSVDDLHKLCKENNMDVLETDIIAQTYTFIKAIKR